MWIVEHPVGRCWGRSVSSMGMAKPDSRGGRKLALEAMPLKTCFRLPIGRSPTQVGWI